MKRLSSTLETNVWRSDCINFRTSKQLETVQDQFKSNVDFYDGHYHVKLPWKPFHDTLPDNFRLCRRRLRSLLGKLKTQNIIEEYDGVIKDQLKRGIIKEIKPSGAKTAGAVHYYIPHHPVLSRDKNTTKLRIVYDASAKADNNPSLNKCLYKGPCCQR